MSVRVNRAESLCSALPDNANCAVKLALMTGCLCGFVGGKEHAMNATTILNLPAWAVMWPSAGGVFFGLKGMFWLVRLGIQFFLFDARPYLTNLGLRLGYHGMTLV